jgi:hypothetical protein
MSASGRTAASILVFSIENGETQMPAWSFDVENAADLNIKLRNEIFALDNLGRSDEIHGTVSVVCSDDDAKTSSLVAQLEARGVVFIWSKRSD